MAGFFDPDDPLGGPVGDAVSNWIFRAGIGIGFLGGLGFGFTQAGIGGAIAMGIAGIVCGALAGFVGIMFLYFAIKIGPWVITLFILGAVCAVILGIIHALWGVGKP